MTQDTTVAGQLSFGEAVTSGNASFRSLVPSRGPAARSTRRSEVRA